MQFVIGPFLVLAILYGSKAWCRREDEMAIWRTDKATSG